MNSNVPTKMQAVAIDQFGGLNQVKTRDLPVPKIGPDEVLIQVDTAGVGVWDPMQREGDLKEFVKGELKFPFVLGSDGAGTVAAIGDQVKDFEVGDHVYGFGLDSANGGFYAEYIALPTDHISRVPKGLSLDQAGAMPFDAITALCGLDKALKLKSGEAIMIIGASGGIGHLAVQLAKRMGAMVFAIASGKDGVELVKALGADVTVDGHGSGVLEEAKKFAPIGFDCALATTGGKATDEFLTAMKRDGRIAYPNGVSPEPKPAAGIKATAYDGMPDQGTIERLNQLIEMGPFEVHIAKTFTLDQAVQAQRMLDEHYLGKLALKAR